MRTNSTLTRLPTTLPFVPRGSFDVTDFDGWDEPNDAAAPVSDHRATAPPQLRSGSPLGDAPLTTRFIGGPDHA